MPRVQNERRITVGYKFRGKRKDNEEWVYGSLVQYRDEWFIVSFDIICFDAQYGDVWISFPQSKTLVIPETVGMFTGLNDRNGKDIYQGDILRLWRSVGAKGQLRGEYYTLLPVVYCVTWCQFTADDVSTKTQYPIWQTFGAVEVVGNIHENPELLEVNNVKQL
jgi:uncharacterized phage protein (TIGR01671 family)